MSQGKFVSNPEEIPQEEHFAIFGGSSYYTDGYDRSDPGVHTPFIKYWAYPTKERLLEAIKHSEATSYGKKSYKVCKIIPMKLEISIDVVVR